MARKSRTVFVCEKCGGESPRWEGRCPHCGEWNTLSEFRAPNPVRSTGTWSGTSMTKPVRLVDVSAEEQPRHTFRSSELNRVLGGGMAPGSVTLVAGDPGIGKSTLLLDVAADAAAERPALYVTGEESTTQVKMRGDRLGIRVDKLYILAATGLDQILSHLESLEPSFVVVDSIQTMYDENLPSGAGSPAQIRECARRLTQWAKTTGGAVVLAGHVTKGGDIAGPRILEHVVDVVLYMEGDPVNAFRLLRSVKNRFGSTNEVGVFEMTGRGMIDVEDPSAHLLSQYAAGSVGSIIVPAIEGTRPLLVEVQALTNPSLLPSPRRVASGVDYNRLLLVCAVLTRRVGLSLSGQDVIVNVAGGVRISEPAADLAVALAIMSSVRDVPISAGAAAIGEVGLSGEVRSVSQLDRRVAEIGRLGFRRCLVPGGPNQRRPAVGNSDVEVVPVASLRQAVGAAVSRNGRRSAEIGHV